MRDHLADDYRIPKSALVALRDGPTDHEWSAPPPSVQQLPPPASSGFMLTMGRAQPYKGFHDLLDAMVIAGSHGARLPHLVLAAVTGHDADEDYQRQLVKTVAAITWTPR
jgi:hypothetical protein